MSHVYSSIQAELLELYNIFTKDIPNYDFTISDNYNSIKFHMQPYFNWRENFKKKLIKFDNGIVNTEKQKEIIHLLIFVEYCYSYHIDNSSNYSFLLEIIQTYPSAMDYIFHPTVNTYYPVVNILFNYCFQQPAKVWPTKFTHILYPIITNNDCDMFIKIYYLLIDNKSDRELFFRFLSELTSSKCCLMNVKYDFFMKKIFRIPRVHNHFIDFIDNNYVRPSQNSNQITYSSYFINTYINLYFMFIWMERQMINFIFKQKREDIYYAYYLLHLYLYKDCLVSFKTHLSNLEKFVSKHNIKIFKSSQCWEWMFQIIIDLQDKFSNIFLKTRDTTRKIEYLYNFFNKQCDDRYYIYSYYDSKLAWIIPYPKNLQLMRQIYEDLREQTVEDNYELFFLDIVRYGNYDLVMNSWYFIEGYYIKYFKISEYDYYKVTENDAVTLAIFNKDSRVLEFICEHYRRTEVTIDTISKCFYNLFIFYSNCYKWKQNNLLRECKKKITILMDNYYFKDIWLAFLLGYFFYIQTYKKENKHFNYLRSWLLKKCIQIEKKERNIKNVIISTTVYKYTWINDYKLKKCIKNKKYKKYLDEYAETVLSISLSNLELNDYRDIIVYMFINDICNFIKSKSSNELHHFKYTANIKENIGKIFKNFQNDSEYMISILSEIIKLFSTVIKKNRETYNKVFKRFKQIISLLLSIFKENNIVQSDIIFYVIYKQNYLTNYELLDWCIRHGLCFYNTKFWETEVKNYPFIVSTESIYYKWNLVAKVLKKAILRYRLKKSSISKQFMHIELVNKCITKTLYFNKFMFREDALEDLYHPRHVTKREAVNILDDSTWVSPKLDGTRTVLYLSDLDNKHPKLLSSTKEIFQYYYFVAEKIFYKSRIIYCIYEVWNKKNNRELNEYEMCGFYKLLGNQQNKLTEKQLTTLLNSEQLKDIWIMKPFYYAHRGLDGVLRWQYIYDTYNKFLPNDGLIVKNRDNRKYKIKPIHQMTIDLEIKDGCGFDQENNEYSIDKNTYALEYENKVVQCLFNKETNYWKIEKIRFDKKRPNPRHIIEKIEEIYKEPYWLCSLSAYY